MNEMQRVVFYDPLSQRVKMADYFPTRNCDDYEKRRCRYLNRIYENLPDIGFFEYDPIVSKDNLLLGMGFTCPDVENKLWAKKPLGERPQCSCFGSLGRWDGRHILLVFYGNF